MTSLDAALAALAQEAVPPDVTRVKKAARDGGLPVCRSFGPNEVGKIQGSLGCASTPFRLMSADHVARGFAVCRCKTAAIVLGADRRD